MFIETKNRYIFLKKETRLTIKPHIHHEIEIIVCTKGSISIHSNGSDYILYPGDSLIFFPNTIHEYLLSAEQEGFLLIFDPNISDELKKLIHNHKFSNFVSVPEVIPVLEDFYKEYLSSTPHSTVLYGYLHLVMGIIFKKLPVTKKESPYDSNLLTKAIVYINTNYTASITLKSTAKHLGVTTSHLSRVFSEAVEGGFCKFLQKLRVNHACRLLRDTDKNIYEILLESGFSNQQTFYRVFKSETGTSPNKYKSEYCQ